jgi:hypothetical protein
MTEKEDKHYPKAPAQEILPCGAEVRRVRWVVVDYTDDGRPIYEEMEC